MYILQISDFHFGATLKDKPSYGDIVKSLVETVKETVPEKESIAAIVCGDIINFDKGTRKNEITGYQHAVTLLNKIKDELSDEYNLIFGVVPGNHDRVNDNFNDFRNFVTTFGSFGECWKNKNETCCHLEFCDINFVFINSALLLKDEHKSRGQIEYEELEKLIGGIKNHHPIILVLHHTLMSMEDNDVSSIRNAAKMMKLIEKHNIMLVLHGHLHALTSVAVGSDYCSVLGAGALFVRDFPDVNSQFNLIHLSADSIVSIDNYRFQADSPIQRFEKTPVEHKRGKRSNYFTGPKMSDAYNRLVSSLKHNNVLYNVSIGGIFEYSSFKRDINTSFGNTNELGYTYNKFAEMWQSEETPSELYFSHGSFYKKNIRNRDQCAINYIIDILKANETTNKAVLSSFNMSNVYDEQKAENEFLPSLLTIQFGFDDSDLSTLKVTSYLRALEASRFLKINICEILYLTEKLKKAKIHFNKIELVINAFRTQLIPNFSCFIKPEIDKMDIHSIMIKVTQNKRDEIANLLEDKIKYIHTVDVTGGIKNLLYCINRFRDEEPKNSEQYSKQMIEAIRNVDIKLDDLKKAKRETSIHSDDDIKVIQYEYVEAIRSAISVFRGDKK